MGSPGQMRVLLVEDNAGDALLIQDRLEAAGVDSVLHVETGEHALTALSEAHADVVLLDYGLPGMTGLEVLVQLKARFPQVPVVMLTAREDHRAARETLRAGAADFISKADISDASFRVGILAILRQLAADRALHAFESDQLSIVAHDLRLPLSNVLGYAGLLLDGVRGPLSEPQQTDLRRIQANAAGMIHLIEGLLMTVRGKQARTGRLTTVDLAAYLRATLERNTHLALTRRIRWQTEFPDGLELVRIDVHAIDQILNNLLGNAVKYSPYDAVVTLGFERTAGEIRIHVTDCGAGIAADELRLLFARFSQTSTQPTARDLGFGLGLYIVDSITRQQGGRMLVESAPDAGTTMTLVLPLNPAEARPPAPPHEQRTAA